MRLRSARVFAAAVLAVAVPAMAQDGVIGPCTPYHAADGEIPSEMPGCGLRRRPAPGSLADELDFARRRHRDAVTVPEEVDDDAPPLRHRHRRPRG